MSEHPASPRATLSPASWTLVVHGGSGIIERRLLSPEQDAAARAGLAAALDAGSAVLSAGGAATDAAEAAVRVLEDDPYFNAGRGSVFTGEGGQEMDAAIMDGNGRHAGAVAGVTATRNPVGLARAVMERSPHVLLAGAGADRFSVEQGCEQAGPDWFATPERRDQLARMQAAGGDGFDVDMKYGTVGAVARDANGHLAAATSTGGVTGKRWGRVGDSPLIGAGTYADDRAGAVSATGAGEAFIRVGVAHEICARLRLGAADAKAAIADVLDEVRALGGTGGVILVTADGNAMWGFNTPGMYRAMESDAGERMVAVYGDEEN